MATAITNIFDTPAPGAADGRGQNIATRLQRNNKEGNGRHHPVGLIGLAIATTMYKAI